VATHCSPSRSAVSDHSPEFVPAVVEAPLLAPKEEQAPVETTPLIGFDLEGASVWVCPGANADMVRVIIRALKASKRSDLLALFA
jgi:hypothetical protein